MKSISIYNPLTGEIEQNPSCQAEMVSHMVPQDRAFIDGLYHYAEWYVDLATLQPVAKGPRPASHYEFSYPRKCWEPNLDAAWAKVKQRRTQLLAESDWVVTKATESSQPVPVEWSAYRQALRDITSQTDPLNLIWPVAPQG